LFVRKKFFASFVALLLVFQVFSPPSVLAATNIVDQFKASSGVQYKDSRVSSSSRDQAIRMLEVNLADPYTKVDVGIPNPLNDLARTTSQAQAYSTDGHQVVGAVNGSFFNQDTLPMYLISYRNQLVNAGIVASGEDQYVNEPIAFGVDSSGKGKIDHYNLDLSFVHSGNTYTITSTNKQRSNDNLILYTPDFPGGYTNTNPYGMEVIVGGLDSELSLEFGSTVTGEVQEIRRHGDTTNSKIPADGFVLSAHGESLEALKNIAIGDSIDLSVNIDSKWQQSDFMLAGGPLLVKDGKVSLSMDPNSSRARERAPRTAVAVDRTGDKVYLVTVDGRQSGYSDGMNLSEFASYLAGLGVEEALNLDGGGSTAMATRFPGDTEVKLANKPSDGWERAVSTILMAVSTAPKGVPTHIYSSKSVEGNLAIGETISVGIDYMLDQYYNPISFSKANVKLLDPQGLGTVNGLNFTAEKAGEGSLTLQYGTATKQIPIKIVDEPVSKVTKLDSFETNGNWKTSNIRANSSITTSSSAEPRYEGSHSLKWNYQFFKSQTGTSAAYLDAVKPIKMNGIPKEIGLRVFGDGNLQWLRGKVVDGNGTEHTVNFTEEKGLTWSGWKYVTASIDSTWKAPLKLQQIYIAQPYEDLKTSGTLYLDELKAIYNDGHKEPLFKDTGANFWAEKEVDYLINNGIISGYPDGDFQPNTALNRVQAAILLARTMNLNTSSATNPGFSDVPSSYRFYGEIAAVAKAGFMQGKKHGEIFDPYAKLTRAEMAVIMKRAFKLPDASKNTFSDNYASSFAYDAVKSLADSGITKGYSDRTFRPANPLSRTEFSVFLYRALH
jgi:hypothetical protein